MNDDGLLHAVLAHWRILDVATAKALHHKGTVVLVTTASGDRLVLKDVGDETRAERLWSEYRLILHLDRSGVPVAVPHLAPDGRPFAEHAGKLYTLSPYLLPDAEEGPQDLKATDEHLGIAIAKLHAALATYPGVITSWTMDLTTRVFDDSIPVIRAHLPDEELGRFDRILGGIEHELRDALAGLPRRRIHGDCHTGNVVLHGTQVVGFVDLDHLPIGPAIYDICAALVDQVKWSVLDAAATSQWLAACDRVVVGYERVLPLSSREKEAIPCMMLAIQLLFAYWLFLHGNREWAEMNMQAFYWLHEHRSEISQRVSAATD